MTFRHTHLLTLLAACLVTSAAYSSARAESVRVEALLPDRSGLLAVFDADGVPVATLPADAFPAVPFDAVDYNADIGVVAVPTTSHGTVWLTPTSVTINRRATIMTDCEAVSRLTSQRSSDAMLPGGSRGISRGVDTCQGLGAGK